MKFFAAGLLFDNDGVLVDSHQASYEAWLQWSKEFLPSFVWDDPKNTGIRAEDLVRQLLPPEKFTEANNRINELEQLTAIDTIALPGSAELTNALRPGLWTVCTSANINLGTARLKAAGIPVPKEIVSGDHVKAGKPNPDPYLLGAEHLGFDIADCVVFEDAAAGIEAGIAAGAGLVVGVSARTLKTDADIVIRDLTGITFDGEVLEIPDKSRLR